MAHDLHLCNTEFAKTKIHRSEDMGSRKGHITGKDRAQIAIEMLPSYRPYGKVSQLAGKYEVSRQTIYTVATHAKAILDLSLIHI